MDASKKKTTAGRGQGGGTRRPLTDKPLGGASAETNAATKRPKTAPGFWPVEPQNAHLRNKGLQKSKTAMLSKLTKSPIYTSLWADLGKLIQSNEDLRAEQPSHPEQRCRMTRTKTSAQAGEKATHMEAVS